MKNLIVIPVLILLAGCASPARNMTETQVSHLSDEQLCELQENYQYEPKIEVEIGKRDIQCTAEFLACKRKGYKPKTPEFDTCENYQAITGAASTMLGNLIRNAE